ncbi:DEAD/DEAH box helicase family protein [Saccharopolyspora pogona]|uniref:PhoH family protein n=1 Tax=Saccharopolyspora pogona TaxID=333966 RepID=UPI00168566B9|nr:PhoH family protein [Saccharopolyspora pogona]
MSAEHRCVADLGPVRAEVATDHSGLIDYLRDFYPITPMTASDSAAEWAIEARLAEPDPGMALTPWRVGYRADPGARRAVIRSTNPRDLANTVRKAIREVLLDYCETHQYTMLHASAVANEKRMVIVVGDKGSGKTTLALNAAVTSGYQYLSNDHLILYRTQEGLVVTSLPTPIPVKVGTYFDYADRLAQAWENEGADLEEFRRMPAQQRYGHDARLLYTYRSLGHANPVHTPLDDRQVVVALVGYAPDDQPVSPPTAVADPVAALWPHVRFDWVFDPTLNTHHLPRGERDRDAYTRDTADRLAELTAGSQVVEWRHRGELALHQACRVGRSGLR